MKVIGAISPLGRRVGSTCDSPHEDRVLAVPPARGVVLGERDLDERAVEVLAVADPVVVLELDPRRREQVEERHLLHLAVAREQPPADLAGIGGEQFLVVRGADRVHAHVARETRERRAFLGVREVVPRPSAVRKCVTPGGGTRSFDWNATRLPGGYTSLRLFLLSRSRM